MSDPIFLAITWEGMLQVRPGAGNCVSSHQASERMPLACCFP